MVPGLSKDPWVVVVQGYREAGAFKPVEVDMLV